MSVKSLFSIILKVLGIFFIKDIIGSITQVFSYMIMFERQIRQSGRDFEAILLMFIITLIYGLVAWLLIFKSDMLIAKLHIANGFDEEVIPLSMHRSTILSISIIVIGGYMVVNEVPYLCRQLFIYYQEEKIFSSSNPSVSNLVFEAVKIMMGLLLMGFQRPIVNLIERKRKKEVLSV